MPWHQLYDTLELYMETDLLLLSSWYNYCYICYDSVDTNTFWDIKTCLSEGLVKFEQVGTLYNVLVRGHSP